MHIVKALYKDILRRVNNHQYHTDMQNAHSTAFQQTGKDIEKAKHSNRRINGKKQYKKHYVAAVNKARENQERRNKMIDDL